MRTIAAISSGSPRRPMGGTVMRCAGRSGTPGNPRCASIVPGTTQFTVILWGARSMANAFVMPARPAFAVITCARSAAPLDHVRSRGLRAEESAVEHDGEHLAPLLVLDLGERGFVA